MSRITFRYAPIAMPPSQPHPGGRTAFRPLAVAAVTAQNGESISIPVLLDSGADACLFPLSLAILLKINVLELPKAFTSGVGTQSNATFYAPLQIDIGHGIAFSAYVGFTQGMDAVGFGLLGQDGFFSAFNVEFRHADKVFLAEKADPSSSSSS